MTRLLDRLREPPFGTETSERNLFDAAADRIEQLERELAEAGSVNYDLSQQLQDQSILRESIEEQLAAEKALADDLAGAARSYFDRNEVSLRNAKLSVALTAHGKAREL